MTAPATLRVVNLGLPKTGTTTLARALKIGGFKVADHRVRPKQTDATDLHGVFVADLLYRGYFETGDPGTFFAEFDALTELSLLREGKSLWPQMDFALIDAIRKCHPDVRFLASRRDSWDVSQSMLAWSDLGTDRLPASDIPGLPVGFGATSKERMQWIEGHYAHLAAIFVGDPAYLEFDVSAADARDRVSDHIGVPLPWWGRANVNPENEAAS